MLQDFTALNFNHFDQLYSILKVSPSLDSSYTIVNTMGWQSFLSPKVLIKEDFAVIALQLADRLFFNAPLAKNPLALKKALLEMEERGVSCFHIVSDDWQKVVFEQLGFSLSLERNMSEYLYHTSDLALLKGKAYHSKRNFINSFNYPFEYREYQPSDFDEIMELMDKWNIMTSVKEGSFENELSWSFIRSELKLSDYDMEKDVLSRALKDYDAFRMKLDVLIIDGKIQAFTGGELLPNNVGAIYFQKANTAFKGIYQFIDNLYIKTRLSSTTYINKQEDMGIAGLRKAKLSYKPVRLIDRYTAKKEGLNA